MTHHTDETTYRVHEVFYTLQGEGRWTGRPAVFCRFSGCNLWTGHEEDRASAICQFCDTDFIDATEYTLGELVKAISTAWPRGERYGRRMVVFTGGEPALQLDFDLVRTLHLLGFYVAIETNGTKSIPDNVDWVCVSPKTRTVRVDKGDELKLVYPQDDLEPARFAALPFTHFWLSPMDGPDLEDNTRAAIAYCLNFPQWNLSIQTHKVIGVP